MTQTEIGLKTIDKAISTQVRTEIAKQQTTQKQISKQIGMHPNVFGRKCRGQTTFSPSELQKTAQALGIEMLELIKRAQEQCQPTKE